MIKRITTLISVWILMCAPAYAQVYPDSTFNALIRTGNGGWIAGDATYSIALPDGRTLWLFGDSFIGTANPDSSIAPGATMIRNCAIVQQGDTMTALFQGTFESPVDFIQTNTPDSTWFWPEHGIVENNLLKIFFSEFGLGEGAPGWNFEYRNACVALFTFPEIELIGYNSLPYYEQNLVMYGDRLMVLGDYTYIYGRKEEVGNIPYVHLARAPSGDLLNNWEFYSETGWTSNPEESKRLSNQTVSQQYGVFEHEGKYVMITQEIWLGAKIYSLTADSPEGPWSNRVTLYETPRPFTDQFTYNAYPHPQFDENNELLISYNSNGSFWDIFSNVELYRPSFIRVPYLMIDSSFTPTSTHNLSALQQATTVKCFPNPADHQITLAFSVTETTTWAVHFYDLTGKLLYTRSPREFHVGDHEIVIELDQFPKGAVIYSVGDFKGWFIHN